MFELVEICIITYYYIIIRDFTCITLIHAVLQEDENRSESAAPREAEYDDENEDLESDADDFIVDDDGRPIAERKKKRKPIFTDA